MSTTALRELVDRAAAADIYVDGLYAEDVPGDLITRAADELAKIEAHHGRSQPTFGFAEDASFGEVVGHAIHQYGGFCAGAGIEDRIEVGHQLEALIHQRAAVMASHVEMSGGPTYVTLTEHNGHEGETWRHYIPREGNHEALIALDNALDALDDWNEDDDIEFELDLNPIAEAFVNDRCSIGGDGYMEPHRKLAGRLVLPDLPDDRAEAGADEVHIWWQETLYKGGIRRMMEAPAE